VAERPDFSRALILEAKLGGYLFNENNRRGWAKGRFLELAGFDPANSDSLRAALVFQAQMAPFTTEQTPFGLKYRCDGLIESPSGETRMIRTVWIEDARSGILRFVTLKPLRRPR
jgi:hypothetical protein